MLIFFDLEVDVKQRRIASIGVVSESNKKMLTRTEKDLLAFINKNKGSFFVGHNIIEHDLKYITHPKLQNIFKEEVVIDTLFLSALLYSEKPYHSLVKDDKLHTEVLNNPVNDSINTRILFYDLINKFKELKEPLQDIYFLLLKDIVGFTGFFNYLKYEPKSTNINGLITSFFRGKICGNSDLEYYIEKYKVELAYALSLINTTEMSSLLPPWILKRFSNVEYILDKLRDTPCDRCNYCHENLNSTKALNQYFGYPSFREFERRSLQKEAVDAALRKESLIVVFPTGGGKSLTFQLPAIMNRKNTMGLTVVISPLQSLMKDQVDTLEERNINVAVAISGLLNPIERKKAIEQVRDGSANLLYIAPESLRSKTIERLLISRQITRFVIDEAHCFSKWGQDFRVDYLYIADFINRIIDAKNLKEPIPVSCFTATAKVNVINDIKDYFKEKLNLELKEYTTTSTRTNLFYKVIGVQDNNDKYKKLRSILLEKDVPTIIYCSRRKEVETIHKHLNDDNLSACLFHGGLDKDEKIVEQEKFMLGEINIMVATSAFGMGIDKDNVERVIHYDISDSLENYVQEAGRAGRDAKIKANCFILYNKEDLNKHFDLLNLSKLNQSEINNLWKGIKQSTKDKLTLSKSALELAELAGWDQSNLEIDTRVRAAVASLEDVGYVKRGHNSPRIFADSLLSKSVIEAQKRIEASKLFTEDEMMLSNRIIQHLISKKYKNRSKEEGETRVDYLADILGVNKESIIKIINKFTEAGILSDDKDLKAHIKYGSTSRGAKQILSLFKNISDKIIEKLESKSIWHLNYKQFRTELEEKGIVSKIKEIKSVVNYLELGKYIKLEKLDNNNLRLAFLLDNQNVRDDIQEKIVLAEEILTYLYKKATNDESVKEINVLLFSLVELKTHLNNLISLFKKKYSLEDVENAIFLLTKAKALEIEGGFMVIYQPLNIERIEMNNAKRYTLEDYGKLDSHYKVKKQQIHIVGEYAEKMSVDSKEAEDYVKDYFTIDYEEFLTKYFQGSKKRELTKNMTAERYKKLFGELSSEQKSVIEDDDNDRISVAAGPGSGKTKLLVHKLTSILSTEDTKTNELLMLTFSRSAVLEFKERLAKLIGSAAYFVDITTFHSFAFNVIETLGKEGRFDDVIDEAINYIETNQVDPFLVSKSVLVIDEAQDMTENEFRLVQALINYNERIRVIAVGDDDQNIFEWRGSSSKYLKEIGDKGKYYELSKNFRSKNNLVAFANLFVNRISNRHKTKEIVANTKENGMIEAITYETDNIIVPLVDKIIANKPKGQTCIITTTNEEAVIIAGLLNSRGVSASLIQENNDFRLFNLLEIRSFYDDIKKTTNHRIEKKHLGNAFYWLKINYKDSKNYDFVRKKLNDFIESSSELFVSDLNEYLLETSYYDVYDKKSIVVSTFHKAKGKEFDNVYILYNEKEITKDEDRRKFYVGITRAKNFLSIHTKMNLRKINIPGFRWSSDEKEYDEPSHIEVILGHRDLYLGYFDYVRNNLKGLKAGNKITIDTKGYYLICDGKKIGKLSQEAIKNYTERINKGYKFKEGEINYFVYWYNKDDKKELLLALPKLVFER